MFFKETAVHIRPNTLQYHPLDIIFGLDHASLRGIDLDMSNARNRIKMRVKTLV